MEKGGEILSKLGEGNEKEGWFFPGRLKKEAYPNYFPSAPPESDLFLTANMAKYR